LNDKETALRRFEEALSVVKDDFESSIDIIALMGRVGQKERALEMLDYIMQNNPSYDAKESIASAYYQLKEDSLAAVIYEELVAKNSADGQAVGGLLSVLERMGNYKRALEVIDRWLEFHPADSQAVKKRENYLKMSASG
jgi:tetratricopeptide (TPR) repeat protein